MLHRNRKTYRIEIVIFAVTVFFLILFTAYSENITSYALNAAILCASSVIPSLFPFMVMSSIATKVAGALSAANSRKAGIVLSVFLGALCGFPVGVVTVSSLYKNRILKKKEAEYLCGLCNNTGPAFVIGVIGCSFWKSSWLGIIFYICQLLSAVIIFIAWYLIFGKRRFTNDLDFCACIKDKSQERRLPISHNPAQIFCNAVAESSVNVIRICGYIIFFKVVSDTFRSFMPASPKSEIIYAVISSILEFTTGARSTADLGGSVGVMLCGFAIGFSGLSVMAQSAGIMSDAGLSALPLIKLKIFIGFLCGILSLPAYKILPVPKSVPTAFSVYSASKSAYLSAIIIVVGVLLLIMQKARSKE